MDAPHLTHPAGSHGRRLTRARAILRVVTMLALLCASSLPLGAQTRTRRIAEFAWGRQTVRIAAVDGNVRVDARGLVEAVSVVPNPEEVRLWVDSVRAMMRRPLRPEPGEELGLETSTGALQYVLRVSRTEEAGRPSRYRLEMHDHQFLNSVLVPMTAASLSEFLDAVVEGARAGDRMRGVLPAPPADSVDSAPALTPESRQLVAAALRGAYLMEPIQLEVVVSAAGVLDSAGAYLLGGERHRFTVEPVIPRLRFSPAGHRGQPTRFLPFAALPLPASAAPTLDSASFLGLRYALRYSPSLQVLAELEARPRGGRASADALVVGDPYIRIAEDDGGFFVPDSLPGAREEARWVATSLGTNALIGTDATEAAVRARLGKASLVHLATHAEAYVSDARARESYVALAAAPGEDGLLTVGEVLDELPEMRAELVVLSACQTGLGDLKQAEGTVGLPRAFLARGARGVLVSLWAVDDEATRLLMQRFYEYWLGGATGAEALRRAQTDLARSSRFSSPRYWAAFQMVGAR